MDKLNLQKGEVVLDVGCGIGGSAFYMVKVNIELNSDVVQYCPLAITSNVTSRL